MEAQFYGLPPWLRRQRGEQKPRIVFRRKRLKAKRPDGEKWAVAERWQIVVPREWSDRGADRLGLGSGYRYVWALIGSKWVELRDAESKLVVPRADWDRVARKGRKID